MNSSGTLDNNHVNNSYGVRPISDFDFIWGLIYLSCVFNAPSNFNNWNNAIEFRVTTTGELNHDNVNNGYGVRPISDLILFGD